MKICPKCGCPTEIIRVIVEGAVCWREHRCIVNHSHPNCASLEVAANLRAFLLVRARDSKQRRKNEDTRIIKVRRVA